jgi:hypothetical protein
MTTALACYTDGNRVLRDLAVEIRNRHRCHLRELWLDAVHGLLIIRGVARCYYGKQLAFDEVRHRCRLMVLANAIKVEDVA